MKLINWLLENHRGEKMLRKVGNVIANFRLERFLMRVVMITATLVTGYVMTGFYTPEVSAIVLMMFCVTLMIFLTNEDTNYDEEENDSKESNHRL